jgi:hypothetical protein
VKLEKSIFAIDAPVVAARLCDSIRDRHSAFHREGIIVPFSGGLDSSPFKIKTITRNISPILSRLGTYNFLLSIIPFRTLQVRAARNYLKSAKENPFLEIVHGNASAFQLKSFTNFIPSTGCAQL